MFLKVTSFAAIIVFFVYTIVALLALYMFGSTLNSNVLENISLETGWESIVLRFAFMIVVACHIPFIFFSGKECLINIYFEF